MNLNEPCDDSVNPEHQKSKMPQSVVKNSESQNEVWGDHGQGNAGNCGYKSIVFQGWMGSDEVVASVADFFGLSGWITEWNSGKVHVGVGIGSDQVKEAGAAVARVITDCSEFSTASLGVAYN